MSDNQKWSILQGDALKVLGTFAPNTFDAVITEIIMQSMIQCQGKIKKYAFAV